MGVDNFAQAWDLEREKREVLGIHPSDLGSVSPWGGRKQNLRSAASTSSKPPGSGSLPLPAEDPADWRNLCVLSPLLPSARAPT